MNVERPVAAPMRSGPARDAAERLTLAAQPADGRAHWLDRVPFLVACLMLVAIVAIYGSLQRGVFTLNEVNLDTTATLTLLLAATGQTIVLIRGGIDLSIGGVISFGTVLAATHFGSGPGSVILWSAIVLAIGFGVGVVNSLLISALRLQPFLITLATWSILSGAALMVLPTDGGQVPGWWQGLGNATWLGLASPAWLLAALLLFWAWFRRTRLGVAIKATGSNERSAYLSGVSLTRINLATYGLSSFFAAAAALYLTTQTGGGSPTIGKDYILPSVAAAVIGGVSLFGGRGGLGGTVIGAFILTIIGNLVFVLHISSYWQPVAQGVILLIAVLASSLAEKAARSNEQ
ncbi:MAG TPA: ABC transporter permease [Acetobacteraceae bacterium]|nr:ABC transporter permease [Acetobacteraceae bacterium]